MLALLVTMVTINVNSYAIYCLRMVTYIGYHAMVTYMILVTNGYH